MLERTAAVWMRPGPPLCPPVPTSPHSLSLTPCLCVCQFLVCPLLSLSRSVSVCVPCSPFTVFFARMHSVNATQPWLVSWPSLSQCHPCLFFSSILSPTLLYFLFALSPPPLPASRISSAPSQTAVSQLCLATGRAGFGCVLFKACTRSIVCVHVCEGVHPFFCGCVCMRILCGSVCKRVTRADAESIRRRSRSSSVLTAQS